MTQEHPDTKQKEDRSSLARAELDLDKLLAASQAFLEECSDEIELPVPEEVEREHKIAEALMTEEAFEVVQFEIDSGEVPLKTESVFDKLRRWFWIPALAGALATGFLLINASEKLKEPEQLIGKGKTGQRVLPKKGVSLHLGVWNGPGVKATRLGNGDTLSSKKSVLFSFTLEKAGYLAIFLQKQKGELQVIYPFPGQTSKKWKKGFSLFEYKGRPQAYGLSKLEKSVTFIVVKTKQPLSSKQLKTYLRSNDLVSQLQTESKKRTATLSFDAMRLKLTGAE